MYKNFLKRTFGFIGALLLIVCLLPFMVLISLVNFALYNNNPLFFQERVGKNSTVFKLIKFKTMRNKTEKQTTEYARITNFGRFLRKFSIDELPQLFNILKGEMSFIGPRPLLKEYLPHYTERENLRHTVRPGMSGLAQVSGRSKLTWDQQFELDAVYAQNISFFLDLKIFIKTIPIVIGAINMFITGRVDAVRFDETRKSEKTKDYNAANANN